MSRIFIYIKRGMNLKANYHTHTKLCGHAIGMSEDYIVEAIKNNFVEIGISDHGPIPKSFMTEKEYEINMLNYQMDEDIYRLIYLPDLDKSIKKYSSLINIRKGLEIEYLSRKDEYYHSLLENLDYLSLGVHYFETPFGIYNTYESMSKWHLEYYVESIEKALKTNMFTVLNHPDLFLLTYTSEAGKYIFDEYCESATRRIIAAAIENNVYLEVNGGGPRRGKNKINGEEQFYYPRNEFWNIVSEYEEVKVIIGCDSHDPKELYDEVIKEIELFAKKHKLNISDSIAFKDKNGK